MSHQMSFNSHKWKSGEIYILMFEENFFVTLIVSPFFQVRQVLELSSSSVQKRYSGMEQWALQIQNLQNTMSAMLS